MGSLLALVAALVALSLGELGWTLGEERPLFVLALLPVPHLTAWLAARALDRGRRSRARVLSRALELSPVVLHFTAVLALGWSTTVLGWSERVGGIEGWPGLELVFGLLPFVVLQLAAYDAEARLWRSSNPRRLSSFPQRFFLSAIAPLFLVASTTALLGRHEGLRVYLEEVHLLRALAVAFFLVLFLGGLPFLLSGIWETTPLKAGVLRSELEQVAARAGFRCRDILLWKTQGRMANAAIVGFSGRTRFVLLTDALLARLVPSEAAAVFAHEVGHAKGRHPLVFASYALAFFLAADLAADQLPAEREGLGLALFVVALAAWTLSFGYASRRFELEADLCSYELLGSSAPLQSALELVSAGAHKNTWRHFGTPERLRFLSAVAEDPEVGRRLRRKLRRWGWGAYLFFALVLTAQGMRWGELWVSDRVVAELRLGHYADAARWVEGREVEPELTALALAATSLAAHERSPEALEQAAVRALEEGQLERARLLVELAMLRGRDGLGAVWRRLDPNGAEDGTEEPLGPPWEAFFED